MSSGVAGIAWLITVWGGLAAGATPEPPPQLLAQVEVDTGKVPARGLGKLAIEIVIPRGFHLWAMDPGPGPMPLRLEVEGPIEPVGPWYGPLPSRKEDRGFGRVLAHYAGAIRLERTFQPRAPIGSAEAIVRLGGQICTDTQCVPIDMRIVAGFRVVEGDGGPSSPLSGVPLEGPAEVRDVASTSGLSPLDAARKEGVLAFVWIAFLFGLLALATPCVFPAIPLTVSFFSKFSQEGLARSARLAAVYALTMVATFTLVGVLVSVVFGVTRLQSFAAHPLFNLAVAFMLVFFSLNLLGLFELRPPVALTRWTNALELRFGRFSALSTDSTRRGGLADYIVVAVAAVTSTTVFFTCTVAFVGVILVEAAQGEWFWPSVGMLAFSSAFALPFFLLALFPKAADALRGRGGAAFERIRVSLGFLELAASLKFLSNADLVWSLGLVTRDVVLALWVALFFVLGLYLLGRVRLTAELDAPRSGVTVVGMLGSIGAIGFAIYLGLGLVRERAFGHWLDGWLPPMSYPGSSSSLAQNGRSNREDAGALIWSSNLEESRALARTTERLVFVNYTGYTCTNCRYMESAIFPRPEIASLLQKMVLVELHTDNGTPSNDENRDDQLRRFKTLALPLYSVEYPNGTVVDTFPGSTNDADEFRRFLERAIGRATTSIFAAQPPDDPVHPEAGALDGNPRTERSKGRSSDLGRLSLEATRLFDGEATEAIMEGRWTLLNFWATYCPPCRVELKEFLVRVGQRLDAGGGRFVTIAVEEDSKVEEAHAFISALGVRPSSALWISESSPESALDPRLKYTGTLPHTVLVSPRGDVVWSHAGSLSESNVTALLAKHVGLPSEPSLEH